jgi:hypothetical protein
MPSPKLVIIPMPLLGTDEGRIPACSASISRPAFSLSEQSSVIGHAFESETLAETREILIVDGERGGHIERGAPVHAN